MEPITIVLIVLGVAILVGSCFIGKNDSGDFEYDELIKKSKLIHKYKVDLTTIKYNSEIEFTCFLYKEYIEPYAFFLKTSSLPFKYFPNKPSDISKRFPLESSAFGNSNSVFVKISKTFSETLNADAYFAKTSSILALISGVFFV